MTQLLLVGAGGFFGSVARYLVSGLAHRLIPFTVFPVGTLAVNVIGCAVIGFLAGLAEVHEVIGPSTRLFLMVGFLGGFTTFSTFGYETFSLVRDAEGAFALVNVGVSVLLGLVGVWMGQALARVV